MNKVTVNNPCKYSPDDIGLCVECGKGYSDHKDPDNLIQHPQYEEKVKSVEELVQELNILIVEQKTVYLTAIQEIKKKYLKDQEFEKAALCRDYEKKLIQEINQAKQTPKK